MKLNQHILFRISFLLTALFLLPFGSKAQDSIGVKLATAAKGISFSCVLDETIKGKLLLQWSVAAEGPLNYFVLERSTDGLHFSNAAIIFTDGNAMSSTQYKFRDVKVTSLSGKIYYRFRLVHASGEVCNSEIWIYKLPKRKE